jgi:uncharacterized protein (DUF2141 family)
MNLTRVFALALFVQSLAVWPQPASDNLIRVDVDCLRSDKGQIMCTLYSSAAAFPKDGAKAQAHAQSTILGHRSVCSFGDVRPGTYAIAVFHDENSNGKLDTNFLGIPREGNRSLQQCEGSPGAPEIR